MAAAIEIDTLTKTFRAGRNAVDGVSLAIESGEIVALIGMSGSGKSTLLRHLSGLVLGNRDGRGVVRVGGREVQRGGRLARDIRQVRSGIGFVFQQFNLVGRLSVLTNVMVGGLGRIPLWRSLLRRFTEEERRDAMRALARVGIAECAYQRASTLSGGQQQRAAIARALVQKARIILADEPIASLDPESSRRVMEILSDINRRDGITVVVCLHQVDIALRYCRRVVALRDGRVMYDGPADAVTAELLRGIYGSSGELDLGGLEAAVESGRRAPAGGGVPQLVPALA